MVLDGVMVILACLTLTIAHPGWAFGKQGWAASQYPFVSVDPVKERARQERGRLELERMEEARLERDRLRKEESTKSESHEVTVVDDESRE